MLCPACDAEWPDDIRYCGACGARMPEATLVTNALRPQVEASEPPPPLVPAPVSTPEGRLPRPPHLPRSLFADAAVPRSDDGAATPVQVQSPAGLVVADVVVTAWQLVLARWQLWVLGSAIIALASVALSATLVGALFIAPLAGGLVVAALRQATDQPIALEHFFRGFRALGALIVAGLIVGVGVALGSALLVLPGACFAIATVYTPFFILDRRLDAIAAVRASLRLVLRQPLAHVALCVVLWLANLGGAALLGVGALFTIPLSVLALGVAYGRVVGFQGGVSS